MLGTVLWGGLGGERPRTEGHGPIMILEADSQLVNTSDDAAPAGVLTATS